MGFSYEVIRCKMSSVQQIIGVLRGSHFGAQSVQPLDVQFVPTYNAVLSAFRLQYFVHTMCTLNAIVCFS